MRATQEQRGADPADAGLSPAADGAMWWDRRYRDALQSAGLDTLDCVMQGEAGRCLRALPERENWYVALPHSEAPGPGLFLKKHRVRRWAGRVRALLGLGPGPTPGRIEARNIRLLTADGIRVMELVAYGERLRPDGTTESFVITEELAGYTQLDDFLRRRFSESGSAGSAQPDGDLLRLIGRVARTAAAFHAAGYNHRDLYCCHFFVRETAPGEFDLKLIDLQRVQRRRRFRRRWLVKDLAQLAWSAPRRQIKCTHKMAFIRGYLGVGKLLPTHKRLVRAVLAKQQVLERKKGVPL